MTSPRMLAGRYRLDAEIGRGSMGSVWDAYDEVLHRRVAIKQVDFPAGMPVGEIEQLGDRTLREARAIAALSHPHVITLYDILTLPTGPVIVMELTKARSLAQVLSQDGPMDDLRAAAVGRAVAEGLMAAHAAGITHRDVKPANVLIGDDGQIKLTDFGIARSVDEHTMTATGMLLGSPAYISPEVASGRPATPAADAWGLGALLYALVEGRPPYDRGNAIATLTAVVTDPVPPHLRAGRLGGLIDGLLTKDPTLRTSVPQAHATLDGVAAALGGHVGPGIAALGAAQGGAALRQPGALRGPGAARVPVAGLGAARGPVAGPAPSARDRTSQPAVSGTHPGSPAGVGAAPPSGLVPPAGLLPPAARRSPAAAPPPPWSTDAAARNLPPLPATAPPRRWALILAAAVAVLLASAAAGYFGVLAIARLA